MKKVILSITSIILCLSIISLCYFISQYKSYSYTIGNKKDIKKIEEKIKKTKEEIKTKEEELNTIKENNKEKVELLEVWEKELKKVKKDS